MPRRTRLLLTILLPLVVFVGVPVLLTWRAVRQERLDRALIVAIKQNDSHRTLVLLRQGANPNAQDYSADKRSVWRILFERLCGKPGLSRHAPSALIVALNVVASYESFLPVYQDTTPIVKALLDRGANLHIRTEDGDTPLIMAARNGSLDTVRLLLDYGADVNETNDGHTALMEAIRWDEDTKVCAVLLQRGADPNIRRKSDGYTPLMCAVYGQHEEAARLLLRYKADVNVGWKEHRTTALNCAYYHLPSFVPVLKQAGARE